MKGLLASAIVAGLVCAAALPARADYQRTFDQTVSAAGASTLDFTGRNGNVTLYGDGGNTVRVHATIKARSADTLRGISVALDRAGHAVRIQTVCPTTRTFLFWSFADCEVEYEVRYPRAMSLQIRNENGNVSIDGAAAVSVTNANGNIRIDGAASNVALSNKNGNLRVALASDWRGTAISMSTHAGNATLRVPRTFQGKLDAHTRMGDVHDNANLRNGAVTVTVTTTFGNVEIARE